MKELNMKEVQRVNEFLQKIDAQELPNNPQECYRLGLWCASMKAFTGEQMSIAKAQWQKKKVDAYHAFIASTKAQGIDIKGLGVAAIKDYIASRCGDLEATYEYVERTNNALGYTEDMVRTVISALKEEMKSHPA